MIAAVLLLLAQPPNCALWTSDGGCLATPAEFVYGRASPSPTTPDAGHLP